MSHTDLTIIAPATPVDTAHDEEIRTTERLERALFDIQAALTTATEYSDRHPDTDLSYDVGCDLKAIEHALARINARLAQHAAKIAPLPEGIEEVGNV
jgi:hypothetical protein